MRNERELLVDCLTRLKTASIDYMLVGSMASNYWGIPRTTHDLDFVVTFGDEDVARIVAAFANGFFLQTDSVYSADEPPHQFNAIDELSALKIDFWKLRHNQFERAAFERRVVVDLFGSSGFIITPEDAILHKCYWDQITPSLRQLYDAAGIVAVQADNLDRKYMLAWAKQLGVADRMDDLLAGRISPKPT